MTPELRTRETEDASTAQLLSRLPQQLSTLIRDELRLAQLEVQEKGKRGGIGIGLLGGAGVVALFAVGALVAAAILALATAVAPWLAAVIVAVALLLVAGVLALAGKRGVTSALPPTPDQAIDSSKQDITEIKEAAHR